MCFPAARSWCRLATHASPQTRASRAVVSQLYAPATARWVGHRRGGVAGGTKAELISPGGVGCPHVCVVHVSLSLTLSNFSSPQVSARRAASHTVNVKHGCISRRSSRSKKQRPESLEDPAADASGPRFFPSSSFVLFCFCGFDGSQQHARVVVETARESAQPLSRLHPHTAAPLHGKHGTPRNATAVLCASVRCERGVNWQCDLIGGRAGNAVGGRAASLLCAHALRSAEEAAGRCGAGVGASSRGSSVQ